jgi:hypothetical protein
VAFDATATAVAVREDGRPDCVEEPSIDKNATGFSFRPVRCDPFDRDCNAMLALVVATDNTDAIPTGATLFRCRVDIAFDAAPGTYRFKSAHALYSPPEGIDRDLAVSDLFLVVGGPPLPTPTPEPSPTAPSQRGGGGSDSGCQLNSDAGSAIAWPVLLAVLLFILPAAARFARQFETSTHGTATELIPQPPSLGKRRGLEGNHFTFWFPLSFQERGSGGEFVAAAEHLALACKAAAATPRGTK